MTMHQELQAADTAYRALYKEKVALQVTICRMRDKLLELAKECAECGGTGCKEDVVEHAAFGPQVQTIDCESCLDIRELLA